ncbi:MAG: U32 family peptidase C-terminal domain-containing protein [Candidatus Gracilibacteria bacterium]|nr:U32 family peptidase C-terminal domain-containing protein [Candidatus Gracilibacteria bacterium]
MNKKLELLMPAGDFEKLKFAYAYGADACYVGVPMFSLRARTNAFTMETIKEAVDYAHNLGKKIYFTANIYAHNVKIKPFLAQFKKMVEMGPDAFIMADPGLIYLVRKEFPDVEVHLSVQANNTNWAQAIFWKEMGIKRIILSREISIKEMKEIHEQVPDMELEAFVHGAICMAYSGRCLISNYLSNRDPNQGTCSHSCRWEYKVFKDERSEEELETVTGRPDDYEELTGNFYLEEKDRPGEIMEIDEDSYGTYLMNSRDLCAIDYIPELEDAGIISFKVEGRNKTVNYIASVGLAYREAIDAVERGEKYDAMKLSEELFGIANRGYIPGFLAGNTNANAQFYERNGSFGTKSFLGILREYDEAEKLVRVEVKNQFNLGDEIEIVSPSGIKKSKVEKIYKSRINHGTKKANTTYTDVMTFDKSLAEEVNSAHGGGYEVWINLDEKPEDFSLIRKDAPMIEVDSSKLGDFMKDKLIA